MNVTLSNARWRATWLRGGRISEVAWIGPDVLAWCAGMQLVFLDVKTNQLWLPRFPRDAVAAGFSCISGHLRRQIFAYAERWPRPRIFVCVYPSMKRLCECAKGTNHAYIATVFAGDFLVSLSSVPDFKLIVWLWRSGEQLASINTELPDAQDYGQALKVNFFEPRFIAQIGKTSGKLFTWEVLVCSKTVILKRNEVVLPQKSLIKDVAWRPDKKDVLAIVDRDGHIYLSNSTGSEIHRIVFSQRCGICVELEPASICWYRGGIVLRTTFCQIRYYQKDHNDMWSKLWYNKLETHPCVLTSHPLRSDRLFFITREGQVMQMHVTADLTEADYEVRCFLGGKYRFVDFVQPWCDCVVAMDESMELSVIDAYEGGEITNLNLELEGNVTYMVTHPDYPLVVASSDKGEVVFVSLLYYCEPKILGKYRMQKEELDIMKFSSSGRYLAACQKESGVCYFFSVNEVQSISIITRLNTSLRIVDILLFDVNNSLKFYLLHGSAIILPIGHKMLFYDLPNGQREFKKPTNVQCFRNYYKRLHYAPSDSNEFLGAPYLTKQLKFFRINDWKDFTCFEAVPNGHNVRQVKIFTNKNWLVTSALDGSITVRSADERGSSSITCMSHHRCDFGALKATVNSSGDLLIALGFDGSLVAIKNTDSKNFGSFDSKIKHLDVFGHTLATIRNIASENFDQVDEKFKNLDEFGKFVTEDYESKITEYTEQFNKNEINLLTETIQTFADSEDADDLTWTEWKEQQKIEEERKQTYVEKEKLVLKLTTLQRKIIDLLDKNETCSEFKKLPISQFDLNKVSREKKMKAAKDEREEVRHRLEYDCQERERVSNYIQITYWEPQKVLAQSIFGIFDNTEVTNYTICADKLKLYIEDFFNYEKFTRDVFKDIMIEDSIYPWENYTKSELNLLFNKQLRLKMTDEIEKIDKFIDNEEEPEIDPEEELNRYLLEGMTTHHFIEPCADYYSQFKIYSLRQVLGDNRNIIEDCMHLRHYFNKQFEDMYAVKEREMNLVRERIDRIVYVTSELREMFKEQVAQTFGYPEWQMKEKPESIIQVSDEELMARVYVSPSQQEILDKQAAEEERIRLAMLADDFRERALQAMMDGVLEVRWEDLIKREPPKPECMLAKQPEDFTDDDILVVKRYEEQLRSLEAERKKYRKILQTDYAKISSTLREGIDKFNSRLEEFYLLKMKVEAAILQLDLRYVRYFVRHVRRILDLKHDDKVKKEIEKAHESIKIIEEEIIKIQGVERDLRVQHDNLISKDKYIEKRLKHEFPAIGKNAYATIAVQFKRRPRLVLKTTSPYEVLDLGKAITTMSKAPYLSNECTEYLKQLEMLDARPATLPPSIEDNHWKNLIAFRRLKIDHELKLHAVTLDLEAAANIVGNFNRKISQQREAIESTKNQLMAARIERIEHELDAELQLVLKMSQVEIENMQGNVNDDSARAVLVPKADVDIVNEAIIVQGRKKLRAIDRSVEFRRGIVTKKWEYDCLDTKLKHLGVELYYIKMANVTREMREYLRRKAQGLKEDKTTQKMQRDFEATRISQEKLLSDWKIKLEEVSKEALRIQKKNEKLDDKIINMNVDRCDLELKRDLEGEHRQIEFKRKIVALLTERSAVIRKLLQNYEELLAIRQELERNCISGEPVRSTSDMCLAEKIK